MKTLLDFFLFLIILCVSINIIPVVRSKCIPDQQLSLLHFKKSLVFNASLSTKLISWNSSADCCSWVGVTCSANGRILGLDISSESISGGIDNSSSLFQLQHLQSLNLAYNELGNGSQLIPSAIGQLTSLRYLNLSRNYYSGQIPIEISHLTGLKVLDFSYNYFLLHDSRLKLESPNLHMLVENLEELRELYLDHVQISSPGSVWCQAISSSLPNLRVLSLSNCSLSGPFHQSLAKLHSTLSVIHLDANNISAPVPPFFANFSNLTSLSLGDCGLHGTFPKEIFQLPSLQSIDLSQNPQLDGSLPEFPKNGSLEFLDLGMTNFSGSLPNSIGNLKMLSAIYLNECNFTGSIPMSITNLTQLIVLDMYETKFEGPIPSFSEAKNLKLLDFTTNRLTGNINCTNWGNLTNLSELRLSDNMLNGNIPSSLLSPLLNELDLSFNQFFGQFPEISNISSYLVNSLDLGFNNLEGPIPMSIFNLRGLTDLDLSSNNFSGSFPLDDLQHLRNLYFLGLSDNSFSLTHDATNFSYAYFPQFEDLRLASGRLTTFPHFLRNQSKLEILHLSENQILGKIPNWIWSFSNLFELNLSCNSLETLEGPTINLTSLYMLDLHSNQLHGKIPISSSPNMYYLDYSRNNFSSTIPTTIGDQLLNAGFFSISSNNLEGIIPGSICNSNSLEVLELSNNFLSGTVPQCLTTMRTLAVLDLRRNNLTKVGELSSKCNLKTLDFRENQIQGQFPKSLVNCKTLEVLNLGNNEITDLFPCFLKNTSTLRVLALRSNKLYGRIGCPESNGSWPMLQIIDLAHNNFSGEVPGRALTTWQAMRAHEHVAPSKLDHLQFQDDTSYKIYYQDDIIVTNKGSEMELVKILTVFTSIDISCNKFNGSIPEEIGELKSLHVINFSNNFFTGAIPSSLSDLSQLESLDLSKNNLSGQIPPQLTKLTFLEVLDLSNNQLVGRIPSNNQFSTFPKASFEGNKDLFGPPLTEDDKTRLSPPALKKNHPNSGDEIDWDVISVEIGFTFGLGISIGSLFFCKRWRTWYYRAMYNLLVKIFPQLEQRLGNHRRHVYISQRFWRH